MATVELTKENFAETINNNDMVIVDFWATWCGPCKAFAPIYEKVSEQHPDVVFAKVNTDEERELAMEFQIRSIPTLMIFRENIIIFSQPGMLPEQAFAEIIGKAKDVDMEEVKKEVAEQQKADS
ncbi:putative thioredoxin [Magnetofaba australis IT-1]|uniref:Thioredoxin n=1 Tax=Magnetofaba australis IT-1 TaxID=1434232 RepID=A0A1Y2K670_9PROT|nr:thioredoxin [Magnetofaba australis]OSM05171.1 putative thioredoxin [Magnetofaba australis IT-1]